MLLLLSSALLALRSCWAHTPVSAPSFITTVPTDESLAEQLCEGLPHLLLAYHIAVLRQGSHAMLSLVCQRLCRLRRGVQSPAAARAAPTASAAPAAATAIAAMSAAVAIDQRCHNTDHPTSLCYQLYFTALPKE